MGKVIGLGAKQPEDRPHLAGEAFCGACGHEWVAVEPVGNTHFECPKCHRWWGAYKHAAKPKDGDFWRCNCGETLFWLTPTGAMCRRCGTRSADWAE